MAQNPIRTAAAATAGLVAGSLLEAIVKRFGYTLNVGESLVDLDFNVGEPPLLIHSVATGYDYFLDTSDTTTIDDGLTCLVSGNGLRYHIEDSASISLNSILSVETAPPGGEVAGDAYRVGAAATGSFAGHDDDIALHTRRGYVFATPEIGLTVLNRATGANEQFTVGGWDDFLVVLGDGSVYPAKLLFPLGVSVEAQQNAPPVSPTDGQAYLVGAAGSGAWAGQSNKVAVRVAGAWGFIAAYGGAQVYDKTSRSSLVYDATSGTWGVGAGGGGIECEGRLTTESGAAISTSDRTTQATLYFTPFRGNRVGVYTGGQWSIRTFSQISLSLSGATIGKPFDIFLYDNAGTLTLESLVWTNDTTRATGLALQDGILVKSGDATRRYLGTIYTTATGQTEDSLTKRMVWNYYNRVARPMRLIDTTGGWTYNSATLRQANATASNQLEIVRGLDEDEVTARVSVHVSGNLSNAGSGAVGIGLDSTTAVATGCLLGQAHSESNDRDVSIVAHWTGNAVAGRHTLVWLEAATSSTVEFADTSGQSGMHGTVWG